MGLSERAVKVGGDGAGAEGAKRKASARRLPRSVRGGGGVESEAELEAKRQKLALSRTPVFFHGKYLYCNEAEQVEAACRALLAAGVKEVGFDIEWRVFFKKGANQGKAALLQLCCCLDGGFSPGSQPWSYIDTDGFKALGAVRGDSLGGGEGSAREYVCFLFHIHHSGVTESLKEILTDASVRKFGVNIAGDAKKMERDFGFQMHGCEDLCHLAAENPKTRARYGSKLKFSMMDLSRLFLGQPVDKNGRVRLGNWERDPLDFDKALYAATDAFLSLKLFHVITKPQ